MFFYLIFSCLISFSYTAYFIPSQTQFYDLLKWEEFESKEILIPKVCPILNNHNLDSKKTSFYYSNSNDNTIIINDIFPQAYYNSVKGNRFIINGQTTIYFNKLVTLQNIYEFDSNGVRDNHFRGTKRQSGYGWVGYIQHSSFNYIYDHGHFSIGRGNPFYYNINESLLLNKSFPPVEYILWHHVRDWFNFDWAVLFLSKKNSSNRFLALHRYGIERKKWRIGFTEAVLGSYINLGSEELGYMMPGVVHIETEENRGINTNLMWLVDGYLKWKSWNIYGELLIDDFALDSNSPPQLAFNMGIGKKIDFVSLNIDYTHINAWTGNHCNSNQNWIERSVPIGHSIGSNANSLLVSMHTFINELLSMEFYIKRNYQTKKTAVASLEYWPDDILCDHNFNDVDIYLGKKEMIGTFGLNIDFLVKENYFLELDFMTKPSHKESEMNIKFVYGLKLN